MTTKHLTPPRTDAIFFEDIIQVLGDYAKTAAQDPQAVRAWLQITLDKITQLRLRWRNHKPELEVIRAAGTVHAHKATAAGFIITR